MTSWRYALGEFRRRPGRSLLSLLSVVIAVAAIVAVSSATATTRTAYREVFQSLAGRTDLEIVAAGAGPFASDVADKVRALDHVRTVLPVFQRATRVEAHDTRAKVLVSGINPQEPESIAGFEIVSGAFPTEDNEVAVESSLATSLKLKVGNSLGLWTPRKRIYKVSGIFAMETAARLHQGGMLLAPINRLRTVFRAADQVDSLHVFLDDPAHAKSVIAAATTVLPSELRVRVPASRSGLAEETLLLTEVSLFMASALSFTTAVFIVLSVFLMNISERRRQLAILRAVGATRGQVLGMVCYEALLLGLGGTLLGMPLGIYGGAFLMQSMAGMLGVKLPPRPDLNWAFLIGGAMGPVICLLASWFPARKASRVSPLEGMRPVIATSAGRSHRLPTVLGIVGLSISGLSGLSSVAGYLPIWASVLSLILSLVSAVLLLPTLLPPAVRLLVWPVRHHLGVEAEMSERLVLRHSTRSALTVGVLFMAVSAGLGTGNAVFSINDDIRTWYERTITADFLLRAMMPDTSGQAAASMDESLSKQIAAFDGVELVDPVRYVRVEVDGRDAVMLARDFSLHDRLPLDVLEGDETAILSELRSGEAVIGSVLAERVKVGVGDTIEVTRGTDKHTFRIAALATEYAFGGSILTIDRETAKRVFDIEGVDSFMIKARGDHLAELQPKLQSLADENGLLLQSFGEVVRMINATVAGVTGGLWVLLALGLLVGALGVVNTLTMNVLEQTRELGMLRAIGMRRAQIVKTVIGQAAIIGLLGILAGSASGVGLSKTFNGCLRTMFGRYLEFSLRPDFVLALVGAALAVVMIAALVPARRAARLNPLSSMRQD